MKLTNSNNQTYNFNNEEMLTIFMYAYGYVDLSIKGHLPIDLGNDYDTSMLTDKLKQALDEEYEVIEKVLGG